MPKRKLPGDLHMAERITDHYQIEKELAGRLMAGTKAARTELYSAVYDELFQRVPDHPQLVTKNDPSKRQKAVRKRLGLMSRDLGPDKTFLEIGPGDCALTQAAAAQARKVYAVDVSTEITAGALPDNVELILSDGSSIDVPAGSVDVAFSDQLMEHLHPDDAFEQLSNIARALKDGGVYYCLTPNRLTGPHDISAFFADVAEGFHLCEYTNKDLKALFREVGFDRFNAYVSLRAFYAPVPLWLKILAEEVLHRLPASIRTPLSLNRRVNSALDIVLAARKGA